MEYMFWKLLESKKRPAPEYLYTDENRRWQKFLCKNTDQKLFRLNCPEKKKNRAFSKDKKNNK